MESIAGSSFRPSTTSGRTAFYHFSPSVCERLQQFLGWLARKFGHETEQGWLIDLRLTHQDISEAIGTTRVTVTRLLNLLKQDNQIICDSEALLRLRSMVRKQQSADRGRLILLKSSQANWL